MAAIFIYTWLSTLYISTLNIAFIGTVANSTRTVPIAPNSHRMRWVNSYAIYTSISRCLSSDLIPINKCILHICRLLQPTSKLRLLREPQCQLSIPASMSPEAAIPPPRNTPSQQNTLRAIPPFSHFMYSRTAHLTCWPL